MKFTTMQAPLPLQQVKQTAGCVMRRVTTHVGSQISLLLLGWTEICEKLVKQLAVKVGRDVFHTKLTNTTFCIITYTYIKEAD